MVLLVAFLSAAIFGCAPMVIEEYPRFPAIPEHRR